MSRSHTPDPLSPESQQPVGRSPGLPPSPTMQQRIKAIGVPTPLAMSSPIRRYVTNAFCTCAPTLYDFNFLFYLLNQIFTFYFT